MAIISFSREASKAEMAREIDRRGTVIEKLESDYDALVKERDALKADRDFWKEQFQVETRYRIELADKGTLQALTDANNRMSSAEAERDELHDTVRMLKKARDTLAADKAELVAALEKAIRACDEGRMVSLGVSGMTIEAQIKNSVYNRVPSWPIEEARDLLARHSAPKPTGEG